MGKLSLQLIFFDAFEQLDDANFTVIFWDDSVRQFGTCGDFKLRFKTKEALKKLLVDMSLGFDEGYINGDIEVEGDLRQVVRVGLSSSQWACSNMWVRRI